MHVSGRSLRRAALQPVCAVLRPIAEAISRIGGWVPHGCACRAGCALMAPRYRLATATVLCIFGTVPMPVLLNFHRADAVTGGVAAIAFVAWWCHPRRRARATWWVALGTCGACFAVIGLVYARYVDRAARLEPLPAELSHAEGTNASHVMAFYRYDLGGFIDHEWLWRIDAPPAVVARVITGLGLEPAHAVPQRFWRMPPHYWPRALPRRPEAFQSRQFSADSRGPDGAHYFLLHDTRQEHAFVWFKSNF
jgi:hypothetical protein